MTFISLTLVILALYGSALKLPKTNKQTKCFPEATDDQMTFFSSAAGNKGPMWQAKPCV